MFKIGDILVVNKDFIQECINMGVLPLKESFPSPADLGKKFKVENFGVIGIFGYYRLVVREPGTWTKKECVVYYDTDRKELLNFEVCQTVFTPPFILAQAAVVVDPLYCSCPKPKLKKVHMVFSSYDYCTCCKKEWKAGNPVLNQPCHHHGCQEC